MHRNFYFTFFGLVMTGLIAIAGFDRPMHFNDLPRPVQLTMERQANGSAIGGISADRVHDATIYEAEYEANGHARTMSVDQAGNLVEMDDKLEVDDLPGHVQFSLDKARQWANLLRVVYQTTIDAQGAASHR